MKIKRFPDDYHANHFKHYWNHRPPAVALDLLFAPPHVDAIFKNQAYVTGEWMHELSIVMSLLEMAAEEAERHEGNVISIHLKLGPLSGVIKEALLSAFDLAREGSVLEAAELIIEDVPVRAHCETCNEITTVESVQYLCCSRCGKLTNQIVSGRELEMTALEIES